MKRAWPLLALILLSAPAWADPPRLPADQTLVSGVPFQFDLPWNDDSTLGVQATWKPSPGTLFGEFKAPAGTRRFFFLSTVPGTYLVAFWAKGETAGSVLALTVAAPAPVVVTPPPDVVPPAPPPPTPAADPLGLTASTRTLLGGMTWSNESLSYRQKTLAPIFAGVASNAATYATGQAMIADLESKYKAAVGPTLLPQWNASLFGPLKAKLAALTASKRIATTADLAEAFAEIGAALKEGN